MTWQALKVCGVCGTQQELGIAADGDIVYVGFARRAQSACPASVRREEVQPAASSSPIAIGRSTRARRVRFRA